MKNNGKLLRVAALACCVVAATGLIYKAAASISAIRYITYEFDAQFSPAACNAIKECVSESFSDGMYNPSMIIDEIPRSFLSVKKIALQHLPHHTAHIVIDGYRPVVRINDDQLLVENNGIISASYYGQYVLSGLSQVRIAGQLPEYLSDDVAQSIHTALREKLFDHYTFNVAAPHEWYLNDKDDPAFTLCCNAASVPIGTIKEKYAQLKKQVRKKGRNKEKWMADVRFQNQIVLSMSKGGHYGKGI